MAAAKSFLVLFFKKEHVLSSFCEQKEAKKLCNFAVEPP